jgi:hypothetical protein
MESEPLGSKLVDSSVVMDRLGKKVSDDPVAFVQAAMEVLTRRVCASGSLLCGMDR